MSNYEILSLILSTISVVGAGFAIFIANKANKLSKAYNSMIMGQCETTLTQSITNTKQAVVTQMTQITLAGDLTKEQSEMMKQMLKSCIESNLNAYEDACSKYRDNKIDKERFKKTYITEIRQLVENNNYKEYFFPTEKSRYKAIIKVYNEWEDLEK